MGKQNRRTFVKASVGCLSLGSTLSAMTLASAAAQGSSEVKSAQMVPSNPADLGKKPLRLGLIIAIGKDPDTAMAKVRDLGLPSTQIFVDEFGPGVAERLRQALERNGIEPTAVVVGGPGKNSGIFIRGQ